MCTTKTYFEIEKAFLQNKLDKYFKINQQLILLLLTCVLASSTCTCTVTTFSCA